MKKVGGIQESVIFAIACWWLWKCHCDLVLDNKSFAGDQLRMVQDNVCEVIDFWQKNLVK